MTDLLFKEGAGSARGCRIRQECVCQQGSSSYGERREMLLRAGRKLSRNQRGVCCSSQPKADGNRFWNQSRT